MSVDVVERLRLNEDDWLFGQTARDARREIISLREQVKKLTKERNAFQDQCIRLKNERAVEKGQLAALAEQNEQMRKALTKWRYLDSSYNWRCGHCGNEEGDEHKEGCALSLPDLATLILNKPSDIKEGDKK